MGMEGGGYLLRGSAFGQHRHFARRLSWSRRIRRCGVHRQTQPPCSCAGAHGGRLAKLPARDGDDPRSSPYPWGVNLRELQRETGWILLEDGDGFPGSPGDRTDVETARPAGLKRASRLSWT